MRYKAVVVGLGPAGAAALKRLSELGVRAVGFDRRPQPERPAVCGEFLPEPEAISFISRKPSVAKAFSYVAMARRRNSVSRVVLEFAGGRVYNLPIPGFTISRAELVERLVGEAEHYTGEDVVSVKKVGSEYVVRTRKGREVSADYVIACDGYPSTVRKLVDREILLPENDVAVAANAKFHTPEMPKNIVYMLASPETPGGYAWIIPFEKDISNVGVGVRLSSLREGGGSLKKFFSLFVNLNVHGYLSNVKQIEEMRARWVPVSGFYAEPAMERVLFAGDSLGAVNPINGGGIFPAMALGILAAEAVWLEAPGAYSERAWSEIGSILDIGKQYRKLVDALYANWSAVVKLSYLIPTSLMVKILKGEKTGLYRALSLLGTSRRTKHLRREAPASRKLP